MNSMSLTNVDIVGACQKYSIPLLGVYSKNRLPDHLREGGMILNLEDDVDDRGRSLPGSHWVAVWVEKSKRGVGAKGAHRGSAPVLKGTYFDAFGGPPPVAVQNYLLRCGAVKYNDRDIQNINSSDCGYYSIFFVWWMSRHKGLEVGQRYHKFLSLWSSDPKENRRRLEHYLFAVKP